MCQQASLDSQPEDTDGEEEPITNIVPFIPFPIEIYDNYENYLAICEFLKLEPVSKVNIAFFLRQNKNYPYVLVKAVIEKELQNIIYASFPKQVIETFRDHPKYKGILAEQYDSFSEGIKNILFNEDEGLTNFLYAIRQDMSLILNIVFKKKKED